MDNEKLESGCKSTESSNKHNKKRKIDDLNDEKTESKINAKERWSLLSNIIKKKIKIESTELLGLYKMIKIETNDNGSWYKIIWTDGNNDWPKIEIYLFNSMNCNLTELTGFNNTGNVKIWTSEECLAYYTLENKDELKNKTILELGGGMTGLAGILSSFYAKNVYISDGNAKSVKNVSSIIDRNNIKNCNSILLLWEKPNESIIYGKKFDLIIAADCFFFENEHENFINVLDIFLSNDGKAILFAPERSGSLRLFIEKLFEKDIFAIEQTANICDKIVEKISKLTAEDSTFDADKYHIKKLIVYKNH